MMNRSTTRVLIAEDHQMLRLGLSALFKKSSDFEIVGEVGNGLDALNMAIQLEPDVVLMDIELPKLNGIEACRNILEKKPHIKVLAFSLNNCDKQIVEVVKAGALGYILKDASFEELQLAIKTLASGDSYFSKEVSMKLFAHLGDQSIKTDISTKHRSITIRELEVLRFIADEFSNSEIAARLFISPRTVETHKRNLIQKLKVRNTIGLVKYYLNHNHLRSNSA